MVELDETKRNGKKVRRNEYKFRLEFKVKQPIQ